LLIFERKMSMVIPIITEEIPLPLGNSRNLTLHQLSTDRARIGRAVIGVLQAENAVIEDLELINITVADPGLLKVDNVEEATTGHGVVFNSNVIVDNIVFDVTNQDTRISRASANTLLIDDNAGGPGHLTLNTITFENDPAVEGALGYYSETSFVLDLEGIFTAGTVDTPARLVRNGSLVSLVLTATTDTTDGLGNAPMTTTPAIALAYRPPVELIFPCIVVDNNVDVLGRMTISNAGVITFEATAAGGDFTNGAPVTAGIRGISVSWNKVPLS
jgi:hypothetical protein